MFFSAGSLAWGEGSADLAGDERWFLWESQTFLDSGPTGDPPPMSSGKPRDGSFFLLLQVLFLPLPLFRDTVCDCTLNYYCCPLVLVSVQGEKCSAWHVHWGVDRSSPGWLPLGPADLRP